MPGFDWISFTTDYGLRDGFVAACHGVMGKLAPRVRVLDVTHELPSGDVRQAAALLAQTLPYLPPAVHVAVVDPGVGTSRRAVAVRTSGAVLVGPDNGVLRWAADALGGVNAVVELTNREWFLAPVSATFHGRDIFAPVAARLATGATLAEAGRTVDPDTLVRLADPVVVTGDGFLEAEVLAVDRFGNVQLAAGGAALSGLVNQLSVSGVPAVRGATFADAPPGQLVVLVDSAGLVAVAANGARANTVLGAGPGDIVRVSGREVSGHDSAADCSDRR